MKLSAAILIFLFAALWPLLAQPRAELLAAERPKLGTIYKASTLQPLGPETSLSKTYYQFLNRYVRLIRPSIRDWPTEPGAKFHKVDGSKEHSVRQNAAVAFNLALLSRFGHFDEKLAGATRAQVRADAIGIIHYLAVTHTNNFLPTGDDERWGDQWQSAFWAGVAGQAAWLLWDDLSDDTKVMAARMIVHEADRFNERPPDSGVDHDTKAEENAWNSEVIALATSMFQQHPNAKRWREQSIVYMINAFSTEADHFDETMVDGRPVKDWVTTTNIHPDFTLENHNRVHPDYLSTFTLNLRNALFYKMAGLDIPQGTYHHVKEVFPVLAHLTATNGSFFYVNGQDWWPHRHELPTFAGGLVAALLGDRNAAAMERAGLDFLLEMHRRFEDGRAFDPREVAYPNVEEELMARYGELYLAHRLFGDLKSCSLQQFQKAQLGTRVFEKGGFVTHRTAKKFVSFTWVNGAMALVVPSDDTWFTAPFDRSFTGRIAVEGAKDTASLLETKNVCVLRNRGVEDGFAFLGAFLRCEGKVEQRIAMISLPDAPVLYVEQLVACSDVNVKEVATGTFAVLNEDAKPISQNARRIWSAAGRAAMRGTAEHEAELHIWKTDWVNIDDKLCILAKASGDMAYFENHKYGAGRLQQFLYSNYAANIGSIKSGQKISSSFILALPNSRHSERMKFESEEIGSAGFAVRFKGWFVTVNLSGAPLAGTAFGRSVSLAPWSSLTLGE